MKKLSIIIPIYNMEKYIDRCVQSVLAANLKDAVEVLLINDGSKDSSQQIMEGYYEKYPDTIRIFSKENGGHGSVINFGIEKAKGKYFKILDADDYYDTKSLEKLMHFIEEDRDVDLIITSYYKEFKNSRLKQALNLVSNKRLPFEKLFTIFQSSEKKQYINYVPMSMVAYKTETLKKCSERLLEKTYYVDTEFNVFYINEVNNFVYLDYPIYNYCIGRIDQSISSNGFVRNYEYHLNVVHSILKYYCNHKFKTETHKKITEIMILRLLNTQYAIYGFHLKKDYDINKQKEMLKFDKWLKSKSPELYDKIAIRKYVRIGRKYDFCPQVYRPLMFKMAIVWEILRGTWRKYSI